MVLNRKITSLLSVFLIGGYYLGYGQQQKPNILFIYTDDQAAWDIGVGNNYNEEGPDYITRKNVNGAYQTYSPNLDKLAEEGAYFTNSFVSTPVCSPSRVSLLTGQYASEYGVYDFIPPPGHKLYEPDKEIGMSPDSLTFAEVLKNNGYATALVGKWHVGDWQKETMKKYHPTNNGYDYFMGLTGGGISPKDPKLEKEGKLQRFEGYTSDILTEHAIGFIRENAGRPFLLSLHYRAPHGPWLPLNDKDWKPYENLDPEIPNPDYPGLLTEVVKKRIREYMSSTSGVDRNLGRISDLLKELGIEDNTIVIFTSDNGYNMGHNGIEHKGNGFWVTKGPHPAKGNLAKRSRPNMYDTSLKVPAIIKWPGVIRPGTVYDEIISNLDWYPTLAEMTQSDIPSGKILRGRSLVPLLKGKAENWPDDFYAEYSQINYSQAYMRTYRTPEWKLVKDFLNPGRDELYHIAEDPEEHINLFSGERPEIKQVKKELTEQILEKMKEIKDPLLGHLDKDLKVTGKFY
ncbi:sulfatase family protein [Sinomicrobium soli]|uniref:sulfatase family protein n=1 Tax=Sinomicrobium sp. N-1-3-6 TaxID=2219864 RepID=UPI000DCC9B3D|nr:sulfatase-like hydrolase/transferase [Sinomicrobium sp. N-1-3-6]RAV30349.1 N-acetylgalactosamine-6-sulfatase [Sinomicrobium sp. N-1-3-6]